MFRFVNKGTLVMGAIASCVVIVVIFCIYQMYHRAVFLNKQWNEDYRHWVATSCLIIGETPGYDVVENELRKTKETGEVYLHHKVIKTIPTMYHYECENGNTFSSKYTMDYYKQGE